MSVHSAEIKRSETTEKKPQFSNFNSRDDAITEGVMPKTLGILLCAKVACRWDPFQRQLETGFSPI